MEDSIHERMKAFPIAYNVRWNGMSRGLTGRSVPTVKLPT